MYVCMYVCIYTSRDTQRYWRCLYIWWHKLHDEYSMKLNLMHFFLIVKFFMILHIVINKMNWSIGGKKSHLKTFFTKFAMETFLEKSFLFIVW